MFEDLDDPAAPDPGPGERAAVAARATRLRRRRIAAYAGGGTSIALAIALVALATGGSSPRGLDVVAESPSPSATSSSPEPSTEPVVEPTSYPPTHLGPSRTPTRSASATPAVTRTPTPTPANDGRFPADRPDGKPGWSNGFVWCGAPTSLPPQGAAPYPELDLVLVIPRVLPSGADRQAALRVTNTGTSRVRFSVWGHGGSAYLLDGRGYSAAQMGNDAVMVSEVDLEPGASEDLRVSVSVWECGDTSEDERTPLPPGEYQAAAELSWDGPSAGGGEREARSGRWAAPVVTVRVE